MNKLMMAVQRFVRDEEGTEVVEWALVAGLIVAVGATIMGTIGGQVDSILTAVSGHLTSAGGTATP